MKNELQQAAIDLEPFRFPMVVFDLWKFFIAHPELDYAPFSFKIDLPVLNYGSEEWLGTWEGIGADLAKEIVNCRTQYGIFKTWDDLNNIQGISNQQIDKIRTSTELRSVYFRDCISLLVGGCENGSRCGGSIPLGLLKYAHKLDVNAPECDQINSIKEAIMKESSLALVMGNELFLGIVPLRVLVDFVHKHEISEAISKNPLTGLPGNFSIIKEYEQSANKNEPFIVCHIDINDFKVFNDVYGLKPGDEVISFTGKLLCELFFDHFVGHYGGDDFVLFLPVAGATEKLEKLGKIYDERVRMYYNEEHRNQGFINSKDRQGHLYSFPLMSISMAAYIVHERMEFYSITTSLARLKALVKKECKERRRSSYAFDRRGRESIQGHN